MGLLIEKEVKGAEESESDNAAALYDAISGI